MPTKRSCVAALSTGTALIVAGGSDDNSPKLKIVEMLNTDTLCDDFVYHLGGFNKDNATNTAYSSSLDSLLYPMALNHLENILQVCFGDPTKVAY